jgi:hypothetical protein
MKIGKYSSSLFKLALMPRGFKEGKPMGGKRKGSGRKPAGNVRVWLTVTPDTAALIKRLTPDQRLVVPDRVLKVAIEAFLKGSK